jgi:hypothetical protein
MNTVFIFLMLSLFIFTSCKTYVKQTAIQKPVPETLLNATYKDLAGTSDEIYTKCETWLRSVMGNHPKCCMFLNDRNAGELSGRYLLYCNETSYGAEVFSDIVIAVHGNQATISFRLCNPGQCKGFFRDEIFYSYEDALSDSNLLSNKFEAYLRGGSYK